MSLKNLITYTQDPTVAAVLGVAARGTIAEVHVVRDVSVGLRRRPEPARSWQA